MSSLAIPTHKEQALECVVQSPTGTGVDNLLVLRLPNGKTVVFRLSGCRKTVVKVQDDGPNRRASVDGGNRPRIDD